MTLTQDFYYSSEFKKSYEYNYDFNIPLDINIDIRGTDKVKFKLIDFSMMNTMLNVSNAHKNNKFRVKYVGTDYYITIPDGSYTAPSLRDVINNYLTVLNLPIAFNYDKTTNRYWMVTSLNVVAGQLYVYPLNCASLFGFTKTSYELIYPNEYYSETFVNMLPYAKIVLATNLVFDTNVQHNFENRYSANSGMGDIITWFPRDIPLFSTINYTNTYNKEIEIANKNIKSIGFSIMNEYREFILDAPICYLHFQLITYENINWYKRLYNILNDISYYLLASYFKK